MQISIPVLLFCAAALIGLGIVIGWANTKKSLAAKEAAATAAIAEKETSVKTQVKSWLDTEIQKAKTEVATVLKDIKARL